jgi:proline iminopeptidase
LSARGLQFAVYSTPSVEGTLPLLCINGGLLFDHTLLWPALAALAATRQLIFYDQRGRGATSAPPGVHASRIAFDAGDVRALREALGIARWDILGHSWGGGIAMLATAEDTGAVARLVLVNAVGIDSRWLSSLHEAGLARLSGHARGRLAALDPQTLHSADPILHADYAQAFFPAWFADQEFAAAVRPPRGVSATGAAVAARLRREGYDWSARLRDLPTPALVLHGAEDVLDIEEAERTTALLRHARLQPVPESGHNPFWESPATFFAHVGAFLGRPHAVSETQR